MSPMISTNGTDHAEISAETRHHREQTEFSTGETCALMIKILRVRKQIAQPHAMCQPFSIESRWIENLVTPNFRQTVQSFFIIGPPCIERRSTKEQTMKPFANPRLSTSRAFLFVSIAIFLATGAVFLSKRARAEAVQDASRKDDAALIESFRHVEVASVSDALEQLLGKKLYMTHRMRPIF